MSQKSKTYYSKRYKTEDFLSDLSTQGYEDYKMDSQEEMVVEESAKQLAEQSAE